ncbi:MAG: hypothetical protein IPG04_13105 [Polyangiaceae bacterium]|nr:hypothetical protein [Polyangiaceae bacterium]
MRADRDWAEETFGGASLGDRRRTCRLVRGSRRRRPPVRRRGRGDRSDG